MAYNRPSPKDILNRIIATFDIDLPGSDARLRHSVEGVLARVVTMVSHEIHGYVAYVSKQILASTAEKESLELHASEYDLSRKAATAAFGLVQFTGTNGVTVPAASVIKRADGAEYTTNADITISAGIGNVLVTASLVGAAGNAADGTKLNLVSPIVGVRPESIVQSDGLTGGTDTEKDDRLRERVLTRKQNQPQGGADPDYIEWAQKIAGVTRVWVYPSQLGLGTVQVLFVMDDKAGTIIPSVGEVAAVQAYINTVRPVTADVTVTAPTATPVDFTINIDPNSLTVKTAILAELQDFFKREAVPGGTLYMSRINEAISSASGEFRHVVIAPAADVTRTFGQISTLGTVTFGGL